MKLKHYLILSFALCIMFSLQAQEMSFEEYNPKSTLVVPGDSMFKAKFPFIDVHGHQYRMPHQGLTPVVDDREKVKRGHKMT